MKRLLFLTLAIGLIGCDRSEADPDLARWKDRASRTTIMRDTWGIAHVKGESDADAVFGMIYAQAQDDFNRIEQNYLVSLGRLAEADGERAIWQDLRARLYMDPVQLQQMYNDSPEWLKELMDAWADGLNYYLYSYAEVKPRVITRFEPWMALSFSEGSIGGDIERINLRGLAAMYGDSSTNMRQVALLDAPRDYDPSPLPDFDRRGSNGIAIAPSNTVNGKAMLLINPHTSFYFRSELQMTSDSGLNAYGAVTWGQFFVYQGFNERVGWMHTSSGADNQDEFAVAVTEKDGGYVYKFGKEERPVTQESITLHFATDSGMAERTFNVFRTHQGPVVRKMGDKFVAVRMMFEPVKALTQSYTRTKARNIQEFRETMDLHTNSSNNTLYADADGHIAYFHANFVPRRDTRFDWTRPVDGNDPATEWNGVHGVDESPLVVDPASGWVYNSNNWPYSASGENSPKQAQFPAYMDSYTENPRGVHAIQLLSNKRDFTLGALRDAAYDSFMPGFAELIPGVVAAYDALPAGDPLKTKLSGPADELRNWDYRWGASSVATSVAMYWGDELFRIVQRRTEGEDTRVVDGLPRFISAKGYISALNAAVDTLESHFGSWKTPWGEINRFQRITPAIANVFDDSRPSIPVPFATARWGSLASFATSTTGIDGNRTKKRYGVSGNSFVAVVEFGDSVRAGAITAGGESGDPESKHFVNQAERYATGDLREVFFYPKQQRANQGRAYRPGQ